MAYIQFYLHAITEDTVRKSNFTLKLLRGNSELITPNSQLFNHYPRSIHQWNFNQIGIDDTFRKEDKLFVVNGTAYIVA